ncbi:hypothetical protein BN1110_04460 [bacterium YEK0313]|nr:hypothetical protein BN1110_04460 [bacterium YEK0313]
MRYERFHEPLATRHAFRSRVRRAMTIAFGLIAAMLAIGMAGYSLFEGMSAVDAFVNAAMILSGMGPLGELKTAAGKVFAGCYALASGLVVVTATGLVLMPLFHRFLHNFHIDEGRNG